MMRRSTNFVAPRSNSIDTETPVIGREIDEVLCRNGKMVGRIKCKLEAWWINSVTLEIMNNMAHHKHRNPFHRASMILGPISPLRMSKPAHNLENEIIFEENEND
uniref:Uncharacterized protein n=1 Tax=Entomoneis paludosa TaxID=265537 RepID=A0A7S2Y5G0_9STRA|mmetsp:Transcript_10629/g.21840  ORF Transcript_10629/g.21840 Transcript_10629/m.21840 type:complete len:105 (+) Transcript_10629:271-585(+)